MTWIYEEDQIDDDDDRQAALRRRADKWAKRYIHDVPTDAGLMRVHFKIMKFNPAAAPQYYAHITMKTEERDYDVIMKWDGEDKDWRVQNDASIPNLWDGGWWLMEQLRIYMAGHSKITDYIDSYNRAARELMFLQQKMAELQRRMDWAELNSESSIEACDIIHDLQEVFDGYR